MAKEYGGPSVKVAAEGGGEIGVQARVPEAVSDEGDDAKRGKGAAGLLDDHRQGGHSRVNRRRRRRGSRKRSYFFFQPITDEFLLQFQIVMGLEVEPQPGRGAKIAAKTQGSIGTDRALTQHDFIDPAGINANVSREPVLRDFHWP